MIYRCQPHPVPYQMVSKTLLDDERLSPGALGVMSYLIGRPKNWEVQVSQLARRFQLSEDSIGNILKELKRYGYARLVSIRRQGETRFKGKRWEVFESPELNPDFKNGSQTTFVTADPGFSRRSEKADVGKNRLSEKPALLNKREIENKEFHLKNNVSVNERADGTTHAQFFKNESSLNEKNAPSPQSSAAPPFPAAAVKGEGILFRESGYVTEPDGAKKLRTDLIARHPRYERANTFYYYKRLLNWSDSGQHRCHDWLAKAASFMDGDEAKGKLVLR